MQTIYIQGKKYNVIFSDKKFLKPNVLIHLDEVQVFTAENSRTRHETILTIWLKKQAKQYFMYRVKDLAGQYNFEFNKIAIRDQSTRWGSCSTYKNLNFNWRLYLAPNEISDYVIIHELAHTEQMNHSKDFWKIVAGIIPHYKLHRKWLKENGRELKLMI